MYLCHWCIDESFFYVSQFGHYVKEINRGDLKIPRDPMCQWVIYCHVKVLQDASVTCRSSIGNLAMIIYMSNLVLGVIMRQLLQTFSSIIFINCIPQVQVTSLIRSYSNLIVDWNLKHLDL